MSKTILLWSYWNPINIGDMAHAPGTLSVFQQYLPDMRVILWSGQLREPLRQVIQKYFPQVEIVTGTVDALHEPDNQALRDAFVQADVVIQNSSMGEEADMMQAAQKMDKPFGLFAQSYFPWIVQKGEVVESLNRAAFVFCRDTPTVETLRHAGVKPNVLAFNPDGCFGFRLREEDKAQAYLSEVGLESRKFITVQLRTNTPKTSGTDSRLNPANPTPEQRADDERRAATFRALITNWVEQTGHKVLIAPEAEKEIAHNKRLIVDRLPASIRSHVVVRDQFWTSAEAASVFAQAHTVVCHEPHACILALGCGTPILHTYSAFHSPKYHMFADIGLGQWMLPLDEWSADDITGRLMEIDQQYDDARHKVEQAMSFVQRRFRNACDVIRQAARQS